MYISSVTYKEDDKEKYVDKLLDLLLEENTYNISHGAFYNVYTVPNKVDWLYNLEYINNPKKVFQKELVSKNVILPSDLYNTEEDKYIRVDSTLLELYKGKFLFNSNGDLRYILIYSSAFMNTNNIVCFTMLEYIFPKEELGCINMSFLTNNSNVICSNGLNKFISSINKYMKNEIHIRIDDCDLKDNSFLEKIFRYLMLIDRNEYTFKCKYDINDIVIPNANNIAQEVNLNLNILNTFNANTYLNLRFTYEYGKKKVSPTSNIVDGYIMLIHF